MTLKGLPTMQHLAEAQRLQCNAGTSANSRTFPEIEIEQIEVLSRTTPD